MEHYVVELGSSDWFIGWTIVVALGILVFRYLPRLNERQVRNVEVTWGVVLFSCLISEQAMMWQTGIWDAEYSLPLHMCSLSGFFVIFTLWFKNKWTYLFALFWGVSGGFHSFLTPEYTLGGESILFWTYILWHASIIVGPLYFFFVKQWGLPKRSFLIVWGYTHLVWLAIGLIDWALGANYMYVMHPPLANNPFVQGEFPYHLIGFELAGILHFGLVAVLFNFFQKRKESSYNRWLSA